MCFWALHFVRIIDTGTLYWLAHEISSDRAFAERYFEVGTRGLKLLRNGVRLRSAIPRTPNAWPPSDLLFLRSKNFPKFSKKGDYPLSSPEILSFLCTPLLFSSTYGILHAVAWNLVFPTSTEHLLEKIACIHCIVCSWVAFLTLRTFLVLFWRSKKTGWEHFVCFICILLLLTLAINFPIYIAAKLYVPRIGIFHQPPPRSYRCILSSSLVQLNTSYLRKRYRARVWYQPAHHLDNQRSASY